jgi:hypothetical protein
LVYIFNLDNEDSLFYFDTYILFIFLVPIPSGGSRHHSYFYFSSQSSLSLPSFLPLFHLSYCEHQQTTHSLLSGFSILRSSPRFPLTVIVDKKHSSAFHHHHNAVLSNPDQSLSSISNIITIMSSAPLNENPVPVNNDSNMITTTIFSNISLLHTSSTTAIYNGNRTFNTMLAIGCITTGIILLIIIYIIIKYCNRDEGSYKIDESVNFATKSHLDNHDNNICTGKISLSSHHHQKLLTTNEQNMSDSKEWYV